MKRQFSFLIFTLLVFLCQIMTASASTTYISLRDAVYIREGAGTTYKSYALGQVGTSYTLKNNNIIPDEPKNGNCDAGWYEIEYNGKNAYVCSEYANKYTVEDITDNKVANTACEKEMESEGFPSSYWASLCSMKKNHPSWTFKALKTNLDFITAVNKFTNCRDALVWNPKSDWQDRTCTYSEGSFKPVNQSGVAYYLDPRNFLSDRYIFQFEDNRYNAALKEKYSSASKSIISSAAFYKYHLNLKTDLAPLIAEGGNTSGVNPTHMASRMYQELGVDEQLKNLYQGIFKGVPNQYVPINSEGTRYYDFTGYYNFYNIGVTGSCVAPTGYGRTYCGLNQAKNRGWNSVSKAITGGGEFLKSNYIDIGQYTSYLERFNVVPVNQNNMYIHYYMANLGAPSTESTLSYNAYKANNLLESAFVFYIPVYKNMSAIIDNSSNGATDENNSSTSPSTTTEIATIIKTAGYKTSGEYISGIEIGTSIEKIKSSINALGGTITITDKNNKAITSGLASTGLKLSISNSKETKIYKMVIKGDTSGDGKINAQDLLQVQKNILGSYNLQNEYKLAADTSGDGKINAQDLLQVQKNILGSYKIIQ